MKPNFMLCEKISKEAVFKLPDNWIAQEKKDGERIMAIIGIPNNSLILSNRRGNVKNESFPEVVESLKKINRTCILDGEVISEDDDFHKLQQRSATKDKFRRELLRKQIPVKFCVFDILMLDEVDLRNEPYWKRKEILGKLIVADEYVEVVADVSIDIGYIDAVENDKEGIVVKDINSRYEGRRSPAWLKCKRWEEGTLRVTKYEVNNKGVRVEDDMANAVQVQSLNGTLVKEKIIKQGYCDIDIQYLEKESTGKLRFPSFRGIC